ncbi:MAG TPA: peptidylprolyl isomerase [Bacteroidota bacterium]|nr:peptidylprolyl isomerase [Bacteroidota bacterium]
MSAPSDRFARWTSKRVVNAVALALLLAPASAAPAQEKADTLARVGSSAITASDLFERIDLMPWPGKERALSDDSIKIRALHSLVGERLLADEALARGIGEDSMTQLHLRGLEGAFVRDELYKREVAAKVHISPEEIRIGLKRFAMELTVAVLHCSGEESARRLSEALGAPGLADSVRATAARREILSADTATVSFGTLTEPWEDVVYKLDVEHPASAPTNSPSTGWVVLYLADGRTNPAYAKGNMQERASAVKRIIRGRKAQINGVQYMASVLKSRKAEAQRQTLELLGSAIYAVIGPDSLRHKRGGRYFLAPEEIDMLEDSLHDSLARVLVEMPGGGLTLGMALQAFRLEPFSTPSLGHRAFATVLNETVKRIAQEEFIAREGYGKNLQHSAAVRHDVSTWTNKRLAEMMEEAIPEGGPFDHEDELQGLIANAGLLDPSYQVNVREIFTDSLLAAMRLRELIEGGSNMAQLARTHSKRPGWAERGGESGFFSARTFPQLGVRALDADTGALLGPVRVAGGYSLIRVLGKRHTGAPGGASLDSLKRLLGASLKEEKRRRDVDTFIAGLASKYGVRLYYDRLKAVQVFPHNMFTRRNIGFGGTISAAPLLEPQWGWVDRYEQATKVTP